MRPDQYYTDVIARPMSVLGRRSGAQGSGTQAGAGGSQVREVEVVAEEEQSFLSRQQQYLAQGLPPSQGQVSVIIIVSRQIHLYTLSLQAMPPGVQKTPDRKVVGSPGVQGSPKKVTYLSLKYSRMLLKVFVLKVNSYRVSSA